MLALARAPDYALVSASAGCAFPRVCTCVVSAKGRSIFNHLVCCPRFFSFLIMRASEFSRDRVSVFIEGMSGMR